MPKAWAFMYILHCSSSWANRQDDIIAISLSFNWWFYQMQVPVTGSGLVYTTLVVIIVHGTT